MDSVQGREKDIIILTTTRSARSEVEGTRDKLFRDLSFANDRARTNVAITRAKHGLFILGESPTLVSDQDQETWRILFSFIEKYHLLAPPDFLPITARKLE